MIIGDSGSGKSTSLRNFKPGQIGVLNVAGKRLPFRTNLEPANKPDYKMCAGALLKNSFNAYAIDDSTYLMQFENFRRSKERGYDKFTDMALNFETLLEVAQDTSEDTIVYFLHHPQFGENGTPKPQTIGKMLDNQLTVEGLFSIVLMCQVEGSDHYFITNSDGSNPAKSPMDMFEIKIPNDLKAVDASIREYYEMGCSDEAN